MRLPVPTAREVRWSFYLVALCALALTTTICWGVVHKVNQSDTIVRIAAASADQVERLNTQLDAQARDAESQRAQLQRQNKATRAELRALLRYLREHGIEVPRAVTTPPTARSEANRPKVSGSTAPAPQPQPSSSPPPPASPAPTAAPSPTPTPVLDALCDLLHASPCPLP